MAGVSVATAITSSERAFPSLNGKSKADHHYLAELYLLLDFIMVPKK